MLFYRYVLIYESSMTQAVHAEAVPPALGQDMPQMEAPLPVPPIQMQLSTTAVVLDEVADIGSGWWSDPPPPVPPIQMQLSTIDAVLEEIPDIGSGWWSDPPPIVLPFPPVYLLDLEQVAEEAVADTSQEMVFSESPGPVPPIQIQIGSIAFAEEIANIGSGWWSDPPPPVPPIRMQLSSIEHVLEEIPDIEGGWWSDPPPPVPPIKVPPGDIAFAEEIADIGSGWWSDPPPIVLPLPPVYVLDLEQVAEEAVDDSQEMVFSESPGPVAPLEIQLSTIAFAEEIADIGSGWWSDPPLPVPPIQLQVGSIDAILEEIPDIGSGWWSDPPPIVLPIVVPDSSIAFAPEQEVVVALGRRLRELGMGILKRMQLG